MPINPTLLLVYLIVSAAGLTFTAAIWSSQRGWNIIIKLAFAGAAVVGVVLTLKQAGLI